LVRGVVKGGPADRAGLRAGTGWASAGGDIIVAMDGVSIQSMDDLIVTLAEKAVEQRVTLTVLRNATERAVQVTLEERPRR